VAAHRRYWLQYVCFKSEGEGIDPAEDPRYTFRYVPKHKEKTCPNY